ncbi:S-adenosyl-L-methionine-dependent methyltransferase [Pholiota conissans]|uniref:rRNA adenine N(6)-methyltransferase n=1 Tax=Pholiota conissans TaxID=109636 RepID=A0A9P6D436_9AGAR|nr:S-adenosyl-L-methionine-dependent methyltransferase [Pholiota conissans]
MTELPPDNQWSYFFPYMKETQYRSTIRNPETARMVAEALVPSGSRDKIIIEAYPGAGLLTRALLALPKRRIKKLIVIEDAIKFIPFLKPLEGLDSRVKVITKAGKQWTTYADMENDGDLDEVSTSSWDEPNNQLQFIMQVALDTHGEQLIAQLLRAMPDRQWLFKYGRIPMNLVLTERMWERIKAPADTLARCKVSVMGQAVATFQENVPPEALQPHGDHFFPYRAGAIPLSEVVVTITPRANSVIPPGDLDLWDYCLRKLFVMRATPLEKCIGGLGPGAKNILPKLTDPSLPEDQRVDIEKSPRRLDIREWALIINAFKNWPFRPTDLSIETFSASRH